MIAAASISPAEAVLRTRPLVVALLPSLREEYRQSMERYAREIVAASDPSRVRFALPFANAAAGRGKLLRYLKQYVWYPANASAAARLPGVDLFHVTDHAFAHLALVLPPQRTVVTFHDALLSRLREGSLPVRWRPSRAILAQRLALRCLPRAAAVVADSKFSRAEVLRYARVEPGRVSVAPLGVGEAFDRFPDGPAGEEEKTALRRGVGLAPGPLLLFVGRCDPHKNLGGAIRALGGLVREGFPGGRLVRAGSGRIPDAERRFARDLGVGDRLDDLGLVPEADLPCLYRACDALVHLSFYEGFGLPVLEAMACGLPVVAARAASVPEVAGDAAVLVRPDDPQDAVRAIGGVLRDGAVRAELAARGRARAKRFSWAAAAAALAEVYERVAGAATEGRR